MVKKSTVAGLVALVSLFLFAGLAPAATPELPPAEYGPFLSREEALAGWISLFDGQTTFGWSGAKVENGVLVGGATRSEFGDYELRAVLVEPATITAGGKPLRASKKLLQHEVTGGKGPIVLSENAQVRMLAIRPLGLRPLFNGRDLGKWKRIDRDKTPVDKRPQWRVVDGAVRVSGGPGALEYPQRFGDFVLQVDVRTVARHANGGVFVRSIPGDVMNGYEVQVYNRCIDNDPAKPFTWSTGSIDDRQLARRVVSRDFATFRMTVVARGAHLATWVNGYPLVDWTDARSPHENPRQGLRTEPGVIQLQAHDPETDIEYHGVSIAPL